MTPNSDSCLSVGLSGELSAPLCGFMVTENRDSRSMEPQEERRVLPVRRMKFGAMGKKYMRSVKNI